jgi:ribosomal protein S27AE
VTVNVLVAWSALAAAAWAEMDTTYTDTQQPWPRTTPARWPRPEKLMTKTGLGVAVRCFITHTHDQHYRIDLLTLGWPFHSLRYESWTEFTIDPTKSGLASVAHRYDAQSDPSWWRNGVPVPNAVWGFGPQGFKRLPIRPAPLGFVANTAIFAGLLAAAWRVTAGARRAIRRHYGLCPACGYSLVGIATTTCPECGAVSAPAAHMNR